MSNGSRERRGRKVKNEYYYEVRFLIHNKVCDDLEKIAERDGRTVAQIVRSLLPMMIAQFPPSWLKD